LNGVAARAKVVGYCASTDNQMALCIQ
jgi:hypothetical protein